MRPRSAAHLEAGNPSPIYPRRFKPGAARHVATQGNPRPIPSGQPLGQGNPRLPPP